MTFEQLTDLATKNTVAIAHINETQAKNAETIAALTNSVVTLHDSVMTLHNDVTALAAIVKAHDGKLETLERMLQAYLNTLPKN